MEKDIQLEFTPNPNTLKYVVDEHIFLERGSANFTDTEKAQKASPLATLLMNILGVSACLIGRNYVTITKAPEGNWEQLDDSVQSVIQEYIQSGKPAVNPLSLEEKPSQPQKGTVEGKIQRIIDEEIRPAVAMDGGDIIFERFEDGVVYLYMQGSCAGCPSSTATLKQGIEVRLQKEIPEVTDVVAL